MNNQTTKTYEAPFILTLSIRSNSTVDHFEIVLINIYNDADVVCDDMSTSPPIYTAFFKRPGLQNQCKNVFVNVGLNKDIHVPIPMKSKSMIPITESHNT